MKITYLEIGGGFGALAGVVLAVLAACNSGTGDCPAKETIQPGASCSDDHLQCAYDLPTPSPACDGTTTVIASSCICTKGTWSCPGAVDCGDSGAAEDGATDDGAGSEDGATDDGAATDDSASNDGAAADGGTDDGASHDGRAD